MGGELPYDYQSMIAPVGNKRTDDAYYDLGSAERQVLANLLIAIY